MPQGDQSDPYDLIMVGRGTAAANYLLTLPTQVDNVLPMSILVIGQKDPWAGARGYTQGAYAQNINQAQQVLQRRTGDTAPVSQGPQDRLQFAQESETILQQVSQGKIREGTVREVSKVGQQGHTDRALFKVVTDVGDFYGRKIVFASGAGIEGDQGHANYHMVPDEVKKLGTPRPAGVMDLDQFIKQAAVEPLGGKKVAVLGPTAGTDAVMTALTTKSPVQPQNLIWLMRSKKNISGFANVYPGQDASEKDKIKRIMGIAENRIVAYDQDTLQLSDKSTKVGVLCTRVDNKQPFMEDVDYFVYSVGQTATNTMTAPPRDAMSEARSVLQGDLAQQLEPVYDINQRVGSAPWEHVTAVQLGGARSDEGLLIIGAAAFQMAANMEHNFLQRDFDQLLVSLKNNWPALESCANQTFPELMATAKLKDMKPLPPDQCDLKAKALLGAWEALMEKNFNTWTQLKQLGSGPAAETIKSTCTKVRHLCYLFKQRNQAAAYLFDGKQVKTVQAMLNTAQALPASLSDCRLIASVAANINALNASSPRHLASKTELNTSNGSKFQVNYLEDKTELRIYIAQHYPDIEEAYAQKFIERVSTERKMTGNLGFSQDQIKAFEADLLVMNASYRNLSSFSASCRRPK